MRAVLLLLCLLCSSAMASPCPRREALARAAAAVFPPEVRGDGDGSVLAIEPARLACTRVRAHAPLGLLTYDTGDGLLVALVDGETAVWQDGHVTADSLRTAIESATAADLDGDGVDELLLVVRSYRHELSGGEMLSILALPDATHAEATLLGSVTLSSRGTPDSWDCTSTWKLVRGPHRTHNIETFGACGRITPHDFPIGPHRYALRDGALTPASSP